MSNYEASIDKQLEEVLKEFKTQTMRPQIEKGIDAAADVLKRNLESAIPLGDSAPHFKNSWYTKKDYTGVRYVKNSKKVEGDGGRLVPLASYLEHAVSSPHKGFIKRTVRNSKQAMINAFWKAFNQGGK